MRPAERQELREITQAIRNKSATKEQWRRFTELTGIKREETEPFRSFEESHPGAGGTRQ